MLKIITTESLKKLVHEIENQAKEANKKETESLKNKLIEVRKYNVNLENKCIKAQQEVELLKSRTKEFTKEQPTDNFDKLAKDIFNS